MFHKEFDHKNLKKTPQKVAYLWQLGVFFFAAPTAQNSPVLHFHFINSFILSSLVTLSIYYRAANLETLIKVSTEA